MVGYDTEDRAYALELTFNYGVTAYPRGEALRDIALRLRQPLLDALTAAGELGFGPAESNGTSTHLTGPDGYRYVLLPTPGAEDAEGRSTPSAAADEPFDHIRLRVKDLHASIEFYTKFLGMVEFTEAAHLRAQPSDVYMQGVRVVGYAAPSSGRSSVPLFLEEFEGGRPVAVEQWEGRHAVTLPAAELRWVYDRIRQELPPEHIVHELRELQEQLGTLLIAIVRDPDGLEVCLVSAQVFDAAARTADDFVGPDWGLRRELAAKRGVPEGSEVPRPENVPDWHFEESMRDHPEVFRKARQEAEKMLEKHQGTLESNQELLEQAQRAVDTGDLKAMEAIDWKTITEGQESVDKWVNRHLPQDFAGKAELENAKRRAGAGMHDKKLQELAKQAADDEVATHDEL